MSLPWVWLATAWILVVIAAGVLARALFWDRARGRRRCPQCWYDMAEAPFVDEGDDRRWICPECGKAVRKERALHKTRRRWRWAPVTIVLLVAAAASYLMPQANKSGWMSMAPTDGLIWWVGHFEPPEQFDSVTRKMSAPTPAAAELARRVSAGELDDPQMRWCIDALKLVRSRERWPSDRAFMVATDIPSWFGNSWRYFVTSSPLADDPKHHNSYRLPWAITILEPGTDKVPLEVMLGPWSGRLMLPVDLVDTPEDAMRAVRGPGIDKAVRLSLDLGIRQDPFPKSQTAILIGGRLYRERGKLAEDIAIGTVVDLLCEGEVRMTWRALFMDSEFGEPVDWMRTEPPAPFWEMSPDELSKWSVRIRGDAGQCLTDFTRDKYWAGAYETPLSNVLRR